MKRYIRTENDIYDIDDLYVCEELNGKPYGVKNSGLAIYKESIVKTADTIEELCEEFVFINEQKLIKHRTFTHLEWAIANCKRNNIDISSIYGAIWTDKGLIFVARMNNEGEIELL